MITADICETTTWTLLEEHEAGHDAVIDETFPASAPRRVAKRLGVAVAAPDEETLADLLERTQLTFEVNGRVSIRCLPLGVLLGVERQTDDWTVAKACDLAWRQLWDSRPKDTRGAQVGTMEITRTPAIERLTITLTNVPKRARVVIFLVGTATRVCE